MIHDLNNDGVDDLIFQTNYGLKFYDFMNGFQSALGSTELVSHDLFHNDIDQDGLDDIFFCGGYDIDHNLSGWMLNISDHGCNDPLACNYDFLASNDFTCVYGECGCTDPNASNYDVLATADNGSCLLSGCTNAEASNFNPEAQCDDGTCVLGEEIILKLTAHELNMNSNEVYVFIIDETTTNAISGPIFLFDEVTIQTSLNCLMQGECYEMNVRVSGEFNEDLSIDVSVTNALGNELSHHESILSQLPSIYNPLTDSYEMVGNYMGWPFAEFCICSDTALVGCTAPLAVNYSPLAECNDGSCLYGVSGLVFNDLNADGIHDVNEFGLPFETIVIQPGNFVVVTDNFGQFFLPLDFGSYQAEILQNLNFPYFTTPPTQYFGVLAGTGADQNLIFGISSTEPISVMCVDLYPDLSTYICNDFVNFNLCFRNMGNVPLDGILRLEIDPLFTAWNEITPIDSVVGNYIYMSYSNLMPGEMFFYDIELFTPTADYLGSILTNTAIVTGYYDGVQVAAGIKVRDIAQACSYDPNDKQPDPIGFTEEHFIRDDNEIEFLIRFQNTGNAPALNVVIKDIVDSNFDLNTFRLVANSHNVVTTIDPTTREVTFYFLEILLPDSVHDEPNSHGLVSYRILPMDELEHGAVLTNIASIYFDNNLPVVTNTTSHTIFDCNLYQANATTEVAGECYAPIWNAVPEVLWTERFYWYVDEVLSSEEEEFSMSTSGVHTIVLEIQNDLCDAVQTQFEVELGDELQNGVLPYSSEFCEGDSLVIVSQHTNGNHWYLNGVVFSTEQELTVVDGGSYTLEVDTMGCALAPFSIDLTELEAPFVSSISQIQNVLSIDFDPEFTYQWFLGNFEIIDSVGSTLTVFQNGNYSVIATASNGCSVTQSVMVQNIGLIENELGNLSVFPNPTSSAFVIQGLMKPASIYIYDITGKLVRTCGIKPQEEIQIMDLNRGVYQLQAIVDGRVFVMKLVIE